MNKGIVLIRRKENERCNTLKESVPLGKLYILLVVPWFSELWNMDNNIYFIVSIKLMDTCRELSIAPVTE